MRDLRYRRRRRATAIVLAGAVGSVAVAGAAALIVPGSAQADGESVSALLKNTFGQSAGTVKLTQETPTVVSVKVLAHGLEKGFHGVHVHAAGVCAPPFLTAGGHYDVGGHNHGQHDGDLPVLYADSQGNGELRATISEFTVAELLDRTAGASLIIHADPDNYANVPGYYYSPSPDVYLPGPNPATTLVNGDSGARVVCGVLTAPRPVP